MKIRLEPTSSTGYPTVEIGCANDDLTIDQVIDLLVRPVLLAWGFHPDSVDEYLNGES